MCVPFAHESKKQTTTYVQEKCSTTGMMVNDTKAANKQRNAVFSVRVDNRGYHIGL